MGLSMSVDVTVYVGENEGVNQPDSFRCCPLGLQFYSQKELPAYETVEFRLQTPPGTPFVFNGPMTCSGVVVHCQKDVPHDRFRIWILFVDLPEEIRSQLTCLGKSGDLLCPYCENF